MKRLFCLMALIAIACLSCASAQRKTETTTLDCWWCTPGQARDLLADGNATDVHLRGIATGTPTATATEAQQMTSAGNYGNYYGYTGVYAPGVAVSPSYYLHDVSGGQSVNMAPAGSGVVNNAPQTVIQPIIVQSDTDASGQVHQGLLRSQGYAIESQQHTACGLARTQHALALQARIVCLQVHRDVAKCPPVRKVSRDECPEDAERE